MGIEIQIREQLDRVARRQRQVALWRTLSVCWGMAAACGLGILAVERQSGWSSALALPIVAMLGLVAALAIWIRQRKLPVSWRTVAHAIEAQHPRLEGRLITAIQQQPSDSGRWN